MKYGYAVKKNGILYAPGMEVPGDALDAVGTVSAEAVADLQEQADETIEAEDKLKRGKKSKEE